jgi:hypothetical protein
MDLSSKAKEFLVERPQRMRINQDIKQMAREVSRASRGVDINKIVVSFNASTRIHGLSVNAAFAMLTGWSLRLQGVRVVNFVCKRGMPRCVLGTDQDDIYRLPPCQKCLTQSSAIYHKSEVSWLDFYPSEDLAKLLQETDLSQLKKFTFETIPLGQLCLPSMRWRLRRHHLKDDEDTRVLYRYYILSAYKTARQFDNLLKELNPDSVMVFNGMQFPEATAKWVAGLHDIPVYSYEAGIRPFSAFFTEGEATAYPVSIPDDFQLSPQQDQHLDDYLSKRFKGDFSMAGVQFWPEMSGLSEDFLKKIKSFKQVVPIFTNVIFDTSQPHANVIFPHMFAWLDEVLEVAKNHPETLFVIRAHPDEIRPGKASRESVAGWVKDRDADALPNVIFVSSDQYFSSYEMIHRSKFVMIYNSTIGMEASIMGKPVLCAGKARFTQLDTVYFPQTRQAYIEKLEAFLNADEVPVLPEHQQNARRFLYFQLFYTSLPFDRYLKPDEIWPGFVRLKAFDWQDLLPENSQTLKVISEGLLEGRDFLIPEG